MLESDLENGRLPFSPSKNEGSKTEDMDDQSEPKTELDFSSTEDASRGADARRSVEPGRPGLPDGWAELGTEFDLEASMLGLSSKEQESRDDTKNVTEPDTASLLPTISETNTRADSDREIDPQVLSLAMHEADASTREDVENAAEPDKSSLTPCGTETPS